MSKPKRERKVRMGMIGGGEGAFIGAVHRMAAMLDGKIELVCGAFSQDMDNTLRTGAMLGLPEERLYASYEALIVKEAARSPEDRMEFLSIVTPNHLHIPIADMAIAHGFHVMSDKPAGISLTEVNAFEDQLGRTKCLYGLTHTYLGYPMVWQARAIVREGRLGKLRKIYVEYPQGWLATDLEAAGAKQATWRTDPGLSGPSGCMGDIGSHAHSLVEFITADRMSRVAAFLNTHIDGRRLDDDGAVQFRMESGATGTLIASQVCAGEENALKIRIYGEEGGLEWHQMEPNTLIERRAEGAMLIHRAGTDKALDAEALARCRLPSGHPEGYLEAFANLYRDFASAIRAGQSGTAKGVPGMKEAVAGMAFLEALVESNRNDSRWTDALVHAADNNLEETA
jgi:predicted dehydrogenase